MSAMHEPDTGYRIRAGAAILADRFSDLPTCADCGDTLSPRGQCLQVGTCRRADRSASRSSLTRGAAASARPAAWSLGGRVD